MQIEHPFIAFWDPDMEWVAGSTKVQVMAGGITLDGAIDNLKKLLQTYTLPFPKGPFPLFKSQGHEKPVNGAWHVVADDVEPSKSTRYTGTISLDDDRDRKRIPIAAARRIAEEYGYDQVMIYARKVGDGDDAGEHMTTYGVTKAHCSAMAKIADFLQTKIMGWTSKK